jgi:N-formylglutamate amidohydrolase
MLNRFSVWNNTVKICDMEIKHLFRTIKMLHSYAKDRTKPTISGYDTDCYGHKIHQWIHIMQLEVDRRLKNKR